MKNVKKIASVFATQKKVAASDGVFFETEWSNKKDLIPLTIREKSLKGVISNRVKADSKLKIENANLKLVDSCSLSYDKDTLAVKVTIKILGDIKTPSSCNDEDFLNAYQEFIESYKNTKGFIDIAHRFATNIANARFLWRNRLYSEQIETHVVINTNDETLNETLVFNSFEYPTSNFEKTDEKLDKLSNVIDEGFSDTLDFVTLEVTSFAKLGFNSEVFPSQELIFDTNQYKGKVLYQMNNIAGMHSQKIGNALRTIDTSYEEYKNKKQPIAVETYGSVTELGVAYRTPASKTDFYSLFDKAILDKKIEKDQIDYVVSVLIRGGIFGKKGD